MNIKNSVKKLVMNQATTFACTPGYPGMGFRTNQTPMSLVLLVAALFMATADLVRADYIDPGSPPESGHPRVYYTFKARHSGYYVQIPEASTVNGTQAIQWGRPDSMHGQWEHIFFFNKSGYLIRNRWSRQCLDVLSKDPGPVVQNPCNANKKSQLWLDKGIGDGTVYINNTWSKLDLNVSGAAIAIGAPLIQWFHSDGATNAIFDVDFYDSITE